MEISVANISPCKNIYLYLLISVHRDTFMIKLFDKHTSFPFNVISYPFLDGNIPGNLSY